MPRDLSTRGPTGPLLLGLLLGLTGAGLIWLGFGRSEGTRPQRISPHAEELPAPAAPGAFLLADRTELAPRHELPTNAVDALPETDARDEASARAPRSEREFLAGFRALAPGELEARAQTVLDGESTHAEKIALLGALVERRSPETVRWLAHAVLTQPDEPSAEARSVASHALALLGEEAARDPEACARLGALAFDPPAPNPGLRRRAASAYARHCSEAELDALRPALLNETDELLVSGVLASLAERESTPRVARLQLDFPPTPETPSEE